MSPATRMAEAVLFVYGSLRRGASNAPQMAGAQRMGPATSMPGFLLYDLGPYPALVRITQRVRATNHPAQGMAVAGELYRVGEKLWPRLDEFEGHPLLYRREEIVLQGGELAWAYLYVAPLPKGARLIKSGDWLARG